MTARILFFAWLLAGAAFSGDTTGQPDKKQPAPAAVLPERIRLYTEPDPASAGGLKGRIANPALPIEQILAMPDTNPEELYQGEITGPKRDSFRFTGLPMGKYDLVVICDPAFYEGFQLSRDPSTLTPDDLGKIGASIQKSEPFFLRKIVHRVEGQTGRGSFARSICTYLRDRGSSDGTSDHSDFRRTYKLVILKDVGPGWQIVRARDLYPVWVTSGPALPPHHFSAALNQIRVADQIKDLGDIDLTR